MANDKGYFLTAQLSRFQYAVMSFRSFVFTDSKRPCGQVNLPLLSSVVFSRLYEMQH